MSPKFCVATAASVIVSAVFLLPTLNWGPSPRVGHADVQRSSKITALMIQRRDVLKQRVEALDQAFGVGRLSLQELLLAQNDLIESELALTDNKEVRIALREKIVQRLEEIERVTKMNVANGLGSVQDQLAATAAVLKAKIQWLREQDEN